MNLNAEVDKIAGIACGTKLRSERNFWQSGNVVSRISWLLADTFLLSVKFPFDYLPDIINLYKLKCRLLTTSKFFGSRVVF